MTKFSVLIPCFNSFKHMGRCLDSLENQTNKNFEVIFIDDCSIDNTYQYLRNYKDNSSLDIKVMRNRSNLGPGLSRNEGINCAKGEFITFLDSDDYLDYATFQILEDILNKTSLDCILFDFKYEKNGRLIRVKSFDETYGEQISKRNALMYSPNSICSKVFRTALIKENNIRFPKLLMSEDMVFVKIALSYCNSIYYCNSSLYYYVQHPNSLMHKPEIHTEETAIKAFEIIYDNLSKKNVYEVEGIFVLLVLFPTIAFMLSQKRSKEDIISFIDKWEKIYPDWHRHEVMKKSANRFKKIYLMLVKKRHLTTLRFMTFIHIMLKKFLR